LNIQIQTGDRVVRGRWFRPTVATLRGQGSINVVLKYRTATAMYSISRWKREMKSTATVM
jgi:hypothetical protein